MSMARRLFMTGMVLSAVPLGLADRQVGAADAGELGGHQQEVGALRQRRQRPDERPPFDDRKPRAREARDAAHEHDGENEGGAQEKPGGHRPAVALRHAPRVPALSLEKLNSHQVSRARPRLTCRYRCNGGRMANTAENNDDLLPDEEPVPAMQQLLDNPFLLLFIGIAMPTVLYIVWGVMEIVGLPVAP